MRICGGRFGGRTLAVPKTGDLRPTQDRVREALFSILGSTLAGADFLDLFAGSGAVGLEALSRGAKSAVFVEAKGAHLKTLAQNLAALGAGVNATVVKADVYRYLSAYRGPGFDIAFADPPYALGEERGYAAVLSTLAERGTVRPGGLFIAEMTAVQAETETPGWELRVNRVYGKTRIMIWLRKTI